MRVRALAATASVAAGVAMGVVAERMMAAATTEGVAVPQAERMAKAAGRSCMRSQKGRRRP